MASSNAKAKRAKVALRQLHRQGHAELIEEIARSYGPECEEAIEAILEFDARYDCPKKPPKMPAFYRADELRPPRLLNGKALPLWAVERLGEMLRFSSPHLPYVGLDEVRAACEPRSLAEHAWDIAHAWDMSDGKDTHGWMLNAVLHYGDDEVVRRLTPALRGAGIAKMLGYIGTDAACAELQTILDRTADLVQIPKYSYGAAEALRSVAASRGIPVEVLTDSLVPACGVDEQGGVSLNLGATTYRGTFDANLQPVLHDEEGNRARSFSRKAKVSHPKHHADATALWTDVKEDVSTLARGRARALERAMVDERNWSMRTTALDVLGRSHKPFDPSSTAVIAPTAPRYYLLEFTTVCPASIRHDDRGRIRGQQAHDFRRAHLTASESEDLTCFRTVWMKHPLVRAFTGATVWDALGPAGERLWSFRVASDGTFANSHDELCVFPKGVCTIRVAHASRWDDAERERWLSLFTDYELLSPFGQFDRRRETLQETKVFALRGPRPKDPQAWMNSLKDVGWMYSMKLVRGFANDLFLVARLTDDWMVVEPYRHGQPCAFSEDEPVVLAEASRLVGGLNNPHS